MATGIVKFFNDAKGFGFITPTDGSNDIFVHVKGTNDSIRKGDRVSYRIEEGDKGLKAVNVSIKRTSSLNIFGFIGCILSKLGLRGKRS